MSDAALEYFKHEQTLKRNRQCPFLTDDEYNDIVEQMGDLWLEMTQEERDYANKRADFWLK